MHPNPIYRNTPEDKNLAFVRARGFGTLMVNGADGPMASHIPFVLVKDGHSAELHLVRSNPIMRGLGAPMPALLAVTGADGYISPDWYGIEDQVPTWNYVAVHLRGQLEPMPPEVLRAHLDRLSAEFENRLLPKAPWMTDKVASDVLERFLRMILPCRLAISEVQGTWKLGQNKPETARIAAAAGLGVSEIGQETTLLAELMRGAAS
ncbi:MAG: FMN-binding negative transcriptional regulator [Albidovulum sp.]